MDENFVLKKVFYFFPFNRYLPDKTPTTVYDKFLTLSNNLSTLLSTANQKKLNHFPCKGLLFHLSQD